MGRRDFALTKSAFLRGWQCAKALYLSAYEPEIPSPPDPGAVARMAVGREIGILARDLFPGGVEARPSHPYDPAAAASRTRALISSRAPAVFEATLESGTGQRVAVDILARGRRGWRLIEVKSSTSVKDEHLPDIAFQLHIARQAGVRIEGVEILHLNPNYVRRGPIDVSGLFTARSVMAEAEALLPAVAAGAATLRRLLDEGRRPEVPIGPHCRQPRDCDCIPYCWAEVPAESVLEIAHLPWEKKFHLYDQGVRRIQDVQDDYELPKLSRRHVDALQEGRPIIDAAGLRGFLEDLTFPVRLLDFETVAPAVPLWEGTRPYQQIPFQYSLHILQALDAEPVHSGFLAEPGPDPRAALLASLLPATAGAGSILAYHMPFELGVMQQLAEAFPDVRAEVEQRVTRMDDLIRPFRAWHFWLPEMGGSFSIKSVAPALAPEMSYEGLEIADGLAASLTFERLISGTEPAETARLQAALETYCERDTLAMVRVLQAIGRAAT